MQPRVSGHFIDGPGGALAMVLWEPPAGMEARWAVLHLPAAGDEMNKARRTVALQARAFARAGAVVALLDPRGTGDSQGEHGQATWDGWRRDVQAAWDWLTHRAPAPTVLWGLRLGALLATDAVAQGFVSPSALLLWQPALSGTSFFNQFFRLAGAQELLGSAAGGGTKALRAALASGSPVEVAGYDWHPGLVRGAEEVELAGFSHTAVPVLWREVGAGAEGSASPGSRRVVERWGAAGIDVDIAAVAGAPFWASQEIEEASALVVSTTEALRRHCGAAFAIHP